MSKTKQSNDTTAGVANGATGSRRGFLAGSGLVGAGILGAAALAKPAKVAVDPLGSESSSTQSKVAGGFSEHERKYYRSATI